jgi:hypothetical protein
MWCQKKSDAGTHHFFTYISSKVLCGLGMSPSFDAESSNDTPENTKPNAATTNTLAINFFI